MKPWLVAICYTPEYSECAEALRLDCQKHDVPFELYPYRSAGNWRINTQRTVSTALRGLEGYPGANIVRLDADARMMGYPRFFDKLSCDIGAHHRKHGRNDTYHWNTGTLYYANNDKVKDFLRDQIKRLEEYNEGGIKHYPGLDWLLRNTDHELVIGELPVTLSYIFDTRQPEEVAFKDDVIILHTQASRQKRREIDS